MRRNLMLLTLLACLAGRGAWADEPVVVELFTSQGCASCPPADALLAELADREDVIALALHVDYWDYMGWADRFASPAFTKRQKSYARSHGAQTIYTPQMIVAGEWAIVGHKPMELAQRVMDSRAQSDLVHLEVTRKDGVIEVRVAPIEKLPGELWLQLVRYDPEETVTIERGENAGRTMTYRNIVTDWQTIATWNGRDAMALQQPVPGDAPAVVLVQEAGYGSILAAARAP